MREGFVAAIEAFALGERVPIVHFKSGERKDDVAKQYFSRFKRPEGVVFIGVAMEKDSTFRAKKAPNGYMDFWRGSVVCNHYYFYIFDREWGPAATSWLVVVWRRSRVVRRLHARDHVAHRRHRLDDIAGLLYLGAALGVAPFVETPRPAPTTAQRAAADDRRGAGRRGRAGAAGTRTRPHARIHGLAAAEPRARGHRGDRPTVPRRARRTADGARHSRR